MNTAWKDKMTPEAREALSQALLHIRALKNKLREQRNQPIAIVGGAGRFPGAPNLDAYWEMCCEGKSAITEIPRSRFHAPNLPPRAGLLDRVDGFDHAFFGMSPAEARMMDPQHRLLLEVSWEAFEAARIAPAQHADATGVFVGIMTSDYGDLVQDVPDTYTGPGNVACFSAGRISHVLGFQGPSLCLDTACSSSLVTVHMACQSLRSGEVDLAIAGGCTMILSESVMDLMTRTGALSPGGHASVFDARANGYVRGEGCAMVVLKRLDDALRDGDDIWAVIRGSAVNHDGRSSTLTAPSPERQEEVVREALRRAGIDASAIGYVEAHGTGTAIGDPIELDGLTRVLGMASGCEGKCYIGSGKANTGHLEAAAGVTGLLRAAHALRHRRIPPQANFETLNPRISLRGSTLHINQELREWRSQTTRYAGVSAFGMSGTNAHVILEEAPSREEDQTTTGTLFHGMLAISAQSKSALDALSTAYHQHLDALPWEDLCRAVSTRPALSFRRIVRARHAREAAEKLLASSNETRPIPGGQLTTLVFGSQPLIDPQLLTSLAHHNAPFASSLHASKQAASQLLDLDLFEDDSLLARRAMHLAIQLATTAYLLDAGVQVAAVAGHEEGGLAAGVFAGHWPLEEALERLARGPFEPDTLTPSSSALLPAYFGVEGIDTLREKLTADGFSHHLDLGVEAHKASPHALLHSTRAEDFADTLAALYLTGQLHHWDRVVGKTARASMALPHYPWQRQSHWVGEAPEALSNPRWSAHVTWRAFSPEPQMAPGVIAVFGDLSPRTDQIITELEAAGHHTIRVCANQVPTSDPRTLCIDPHKLDDLYQISRAALRLHRAPLERMLHLPWFGDQGGAARQEVMMHLGKAHDGLDCGQWFITHGAIEPATEAQARVEAPLWGIARAFFFETHTRGGILDLSTRDLAPSTWLTACTGQLTTRPLQLRAHHHAIEHAVIAPIEPPQGDVPMWRLDPAASYLVTGGTGGIGRRLVDFMIARGATHIRVTSRREPSSEVRAWIEDASTRGVAIVWHGADVSNKPQMTDLFEKISNSARPLKGIAHVAGVGSQCPVHKLERQELDRVLATKLTGGWLLHDLSRAHTLDFFLGFSSISSVLAGQGQAAYSAANLALDALIRYRRAQGLPGHTIRWGLWDGEGIPNDEERMRLDMLGLHAMDGERALGMLDTILAEDRGQSIVASIDWQKCLHLIDPTGEDRSLDMLRATHSATESPKASPQNALTDTDLRDLIITQVAHHVDMSPELLPLDRSLTHLGLDSLGGYSLHGTLQNAGVAIQIEDMLGGCSVAQLIEKALAQPIAQTPPTVTPTGPAPTLQPSPAAVSSETQEKERAFHLEKVEGSASNTWFVNHTPERSKAATHRLICFPYAGGNPSVFGGWARHLPEQVELYSLQLPARGARLHEPPVCQMEPLIESLQAAYEDLDDGRPTSFFGHCFGALMMFELADRLRSQGRQLPANFFVSGARNPRSYTHDQLMADVEQYSPLPPKQLPELDDDMLVEALKEMRFADSVDALDKEAIRRLLLPAVRADFSISNSYFYEEKAPFDIPIFAMGGRADGYVTATQLLSWRHHTSAGFAHEYCSGGHYFIGAERERWIERILDRIL